MNCTSQDLAGLTPAALIQFLEAADHNCLYTSIWTLDDNLRTVLDAAHVTAVLQDVGTASAVYQGDNQGHLAELMEFVHAAYYHKAYHPNDPLLFDSAAVFGAATSALDVFAASPHFNDITDTAASVVYSWVTAVDAANFADRYYTQIASLPSAFNTDATRWSQYAQGLNIYATIRVIYRQIGLSPAFKAKLTQALVDDLSSLARNTGLPPAMQYLAANAVWVLGLICSDVPALKSAAVQGITDARAAWPTFSPAWLWTVSALDDCNGCLDAVGNSLCKSEVVQQLEAEALPNTYVFDDGAMVVRTPLGLAEVQPLYHAAKVVQAQFNRLTQTLAPLMDDPNGKLTVILFGSRSEYENYAPFLYGLATNNGGVYIEQSGTFYTYDRTPAESIYPLEELFRHEYSHYLVGRFLIGGMWGSAPIYQNDRMIWFDEGLAEFCTWSTASGGIRPRRRLAELIQQDGTDRMTVSQVLSATYGNFDFYRYAAFLFDYWYQNDLATLLQIFELVRSADVAGYDAKVSQLKGDAALQAAYDSHLDALLANLANLDDPVTVTPPLTGLTLATVAEVQSHIRNTRIGYLATCGVAAVDCNTRFSARGVLSGHLTAQKDLAAAWKEFDADLNELIQALEQTGINNFAALVGRFGTIRWETNDSGQQYPMADYFVEGLLNHGMVSLLPPDQQIEQDFKATRLGFNATTALIAPGRVEVKICFTTRSHLDSITDDALLAELADDLVELRNQVYAIRPPYYRNISAAWTEQMTVIPQANQHRYGLRNAVFSVDLS